MNEPRFFASSKEVLRSSFLFWKSRRTVLKVTSPEGNDEDLMFYPSAFLTGRSQKDFSLYVPKVEATIPGPVIEYLNNCVQKSTICSTGSRRQLELPVTLNWTRDP